MKKIKSLLCLASLLLLVSCLGKDSSLGLDSDEKIEDEHTFVSQDMVEIATVSGDCIVKIGGDDSIHVLVEYNIDPPEAFEAKFREESNRLVLKEEFHGSSRGASRWTVTVPAITKIVFTTASGNVEIVGLEEDVIAATASGNITTYDIDGNLTAATASGNVTAEIISGNVNASTASGNVRADQVSTGVSATTASGNVTADDITGTMHVATASGNVEIHDASGSFQISTASGGIGVENVIVEDASSFNAASGSIYVRLGASAEHDLSLNTASGNAVLDYNGNSVQGYFEFTARVNNGRIVSPIAFDLEETFFQSGQQYWRKSFTRGSSTPEVSINTASGRAELRE